MKTDGGGCGREGGGCGREGEGGGGGVLYHITSYHITSLPRRALYQGLIHRTTVLSVVPRHWSCLRRRTGPT